MTCCEGSAGSDTFIQKKIKKYHINSGGSEKVMAEKSGEQFDSFVRHRLIENAAGWSPIPPAKRPSPPVHPSARL